MQTLSVNQNGSLVVNHNSFEHVQKELKAHKIFCIRLVETSLTHSKITGLHINCYSRPQADKLVSFIYSLLAGQGFTVKYFPNSDVVEIK